MKKISTSILLSLLTAFWFVNCKAQNELYNDGAEIYVQAAGLIYVQGDITNDDQGGNVGRMFNSGNIQLTGNWSNTSTSNVFQAFGIGTTTFLGTGAVQTIGGTTDTYFNNLTINKSGATVQEVRQLRNSLTDGVLNLTNDFLNTQTFTFLVANPNPAAITRTGPVTPNYTDLLTEGYVTSTPGSTGRLTRASSNLFPGATYFYPVGNGTRFRPVEITPTSVGNNAYSVQFVNMATPNTGLHSATIAAVNPNWYHFIERAVAAGSPENVRIYWNDTPDDICDPNTVTIAEWDNILWFDLSPTISTGNVSPILSWTQKSGYPGTFPTPWLLTPINTPFVLADLVYGPTWGTPCSILSVDGSPLRATARTSDIVLNWETSMENNNMGFEIQRSTDGTNFSAIGFEPGAGTTSTPQQYDYVDRDVVANQVYYYRYRQINSNGGSHLSNIAEAMIHLSGYFEVGQFFPSPTAGNNNALWVVAADETQITVKLFNPLGQEVLGEEVTLAPGYNEIPFDITGLADGNYHAVVLHGSQQFVRKFSIER